MKLYQLTLTILTAMLLTACGNSNNQTSQEEEKLDNIKFYENADKSIDITWEKTGKKYKVLAIEKNNNYIKIYETTSESTYEIVCKPLNSEDEKVVFDYKVYEENKIVDNGEFTLDKLQGLYGFTLGSGNSYEDVKFTPIDEHISTNGLDIDMRYGQYKLLDNKRTPQEYTGYFLLLENNISKGKEYIQSGSTTYLQTLEPLWKYDRLNKLFILDNRHNRGGYFEGNVYGNSDEINVNGHWNNGSDLDAKFIYMNDSRAFTEETNREATQLKTMTIDDSVNIKSLANTHHN